MVIDLATIDFCPGQGGEAVIRSLTARDNGVYIAPSGVDGFNPVTVDLPLDDYATKQWVEDQGYLSEDDPAVEVLANPSIGVLNTAGLNPLTAQVLSSGVMFDQLGNNTYNLNGDIYAFVNQYLYKYDKTSMKFNELFYCDGTNWQPLWSDESGRIFQGTSFELDLSTGHMDSVNLGETGSYTYSWNLSNLYKGDDGIYILSAWTPAKYNEDLKAFDNFSISIASGISDGDLVYMFEWNGHHLCLPYFGGMYELIESENSAEIVEVTTPYFDLYAGESNDITVFNNYNYGKTIVSTSDGLYFLSGSDHFKLSSDGHWVRNTINNEWGNVQEFPGNYGGIVVDDYFIGFAYAESGKLLASNPKDSEITSTGWSDINNIAVGLTGTQEIAGQKTFDNIIIKNDFSTSFIRENSSANNGNLDIYNHSGNINITSDKNISINSELLLYNDKNIAITDQCILNRTFTNAGPYFESVTSVGATDFDRYFKVPSGRVFYNDYGNFYEFDGSAWTQIQFTYNIMPGTVMNAIGNTFAFDDSNNIYLWNENNSDWDRIIENSTYGTDMNVIWICGDTLRYAGEAKLVNTGGTWSWESNTVSSWEYGSKQRIYNNTVYIFTQGGDLYTYDESTKTYTHINRWFNDSVWNIFEFDGDIYYESYGSIYKMDFSQVSALPDVFNVKTDIYNNYNREAYVEYSGKLYTTNNNLEFGYVYGKTETVPTVPASNGTYVLKATRTGDVVVYEWVPEV